MIIPSNRRHCLLVCASLTAILFPLAATSSLTLTQSAVPGFGLIVSGSSGRQFVLNTDDTISGTHASDHISGAMAGRFTIEDTNSPTSVNIAVTVLGTIGGLTVNETLCSYGGGIQQSCGGSGFTVISAASAVLKLGLDISTSAAHRGGDAATVTVELAVTYL